MSVHYDAEQGGSVKRSPWFSARTEPPVNGDKSSIYEHRCNAGIHARWVEPKLVPAEWINYWKCDRCQWRGLLREASIDAARAAQGGQT